MFWGFIMFFLVVLNCFRQWGERQRYYYQRVFWVSKMFVQSNLP